MALSNAAKAGAAIFVGAVQFGIFLIVAEVYYSAYGTGGYSVSANAVSDLGANCPATGACYIPPSSMIFDISVGVLGLLILVGSYYLQKSFHWKPATVLSALAGVGALGVGVFPETAGIAHGISTLIVFLFAGLSAIVNARFQRPPMFFFSIILGFMTLMALFMYLGDFNLGLGPGGMERLIVYPALLWVIGFGGHLMAMEDPVT